MPWVRVECEFYDHGKVIEAGPLAAYLWLAGIAWSNRFFTDGHIPARVVARLANFDGYAQDGEEARPAALAKRLVQVGLWEKRKDGYAIHNYLKYQRSAQQIKEERKAKQQAGRKGADRRWHQTRPELNGNGDEADAKAAVSAATEDPPPF